MPAAGHFASPRFQDSPENQDESPIPGGYFVEPVQRVGAAKAGRGRPGTSSTSPPEEPMAVLPGPRMPACLPAGGLSPPLRHLETGALAPLLYPLRGAETLAMVAVMGITLWVFTILVPEYCLGIWADAGMLGTPLMGMLVILICCRPLYCSVLPGFVWVKIQRSKPFVFMAWGRDRVSCGVRGSLGGRDQQDPQVPPPKPPTPFPSPLFPLRIPRCQRYPGNHRFPRGPGHARQGSLRQTLGSPEPLEGRACCSRPSATPDRSLADTPTQRHLHLPRMWHPVPAL